ncbi:MAG: FMN-binding protein [Bacillota bacterium]
MKKKQVLILAVLAAVIIIAAGAKIGIRHIEVSHDKKISEIAISNVDLSKVADGAYTGSYKVFPVAAEVKVTVTDHKIIGIELLKHSNGQGTPAEIIPDKVVEAQTLEVDIVTGATSSSKVILKAIENALNSAIK